MFPGDAVKIIIIISRQLFFLPFTFLGLDFSMPSSFFFFFFCRCFDIYVHTQSRVSGSCIPRHFPGVAIFPPLWTRATLLLAPSVTNYKLITISSTTALLSKSFTPPNHPLSSFPDTRTSSRLLFTSFGAGSLFVSRLKNRSRGIDHFGDESDVEKTPGK